ncbi:MAG: hypothetical protein LLG40_09985 [Deltaproteobacteria bacterium]|nr:hypothetical protein [Deltaproteobacteria bacterium]
MKNLSDEELINQAAGFSCGCDKCLARVEPPRRELLSRLERGRKAIEFVENVKMTVKVVNDNTILQNGAIKAIIILLQEYEATDEN